MKKRKNIHNKHNKHIKIYKTYKRICKTIITSIKKVINFIFLNLKMLTLNYAFT